MSDSPVVITVAAHKGGVGKTRFAFEIAAALDAVLIDADWDWGGATRMWGFRPEDHPRSVFLDALIARNGEPPRPKRHEGRPDLVPSDDRLAQLQGRMDPATWADRLTTWAAAWGRPVVIDTHPGENSLTDGALAAANVIVTPVLLGDRELDALEGMLRERASFPILVAPNRFRPRAADLRLIERLGKLTTTYGVAVAPAVSDHSWLPRRRRRAAICLEASPGLQLARAASEFRTVAQFVKDATSG